MSLRSAVLVGCLLAFAACRRPPGPPSPQWEKARMLHVELVSRYADDAYGRPEMDEVVRLLDAVPADSVDAPEAAALRSRIDEGRKALAARQAEQARVLAGAGPGNWPASMGQGGGGSLGASEPAKPRIARGLKLDVFREVYGDCFEHRTDLQVLAPDGGVLAQKGEAWGLKDDSAECRERYPDQANQAVVFADGALVAVRPAADVKQVEVKETRETRRAVQAEVGPDGGLVPKRGPDGGYIFAPDGGS